MSELVLSFVEVVEPSTNTVGHTEIQAYGEAVRLVGTYAKKRQ
ncbi:MAG: hypothetical protein RMX59_034710 [Nostoc sp. DedSLP05]